MPTKEDSSRLICIGGAMKSIGEDRFGGYLVRFTTPDNPDLHGEYFDKSTYFGTESLIGLTVYYNHALDTQIGALTTGYVDYADYRDDGIYVEAKDAFIENAIKHVKTIGELHQKADEWEQEQIAMWMEYKRSKDRLRKSGLLKWSSGALPQSVIVDENPQSETYGHIKQWFFKEGSETPAPAHDEDNPTGNTRIQTLKTYDEQLGRKGLRDIGAYGKSLLTSDKSQPTETPITETLTMDETQVKQLITDALKNELPSILAKAKADMMEEEPDGDEEVKMTDEELAAEEEKALQKAVSKAVSIALKDSGVQAGLPNAVKSVLDNNRVEWLEPAISVVLESRQVRETKRSNDIKAAMDAAIQNQKGVGLREQFGTRGGNSQKSTHISVATKYENWQPEDFSFADEINRLMQSKGKSLDIQFNQEFYREMADKTIKRYEKGTMELSPNTLKTMHSIKSDEVMYSTLATGGDEHVPTAWRQDIWRKARRDNVVLPLIQTVDMPTNPYVIPVESTDPTVYLVAETTGEAQLLLDGAGSAIPDSKVGTTNKTLTAAKLGLRVMISAELNEDSVPTAVPMYRSQAERVMLDSIDNVILNGDNATSGNVNYDGGTPGVTSKYLVWDGLIVDALVTNSTNALSAGAANPTLSMIRQIRFLLDRSKQRPNELALVVNPETEAKLLGMDEFVTMDKAGDRATNLTGQIGIIDGVPVFVSNEIAFADSDGKITYDGNVANRGRAVLFHRNSFYLGYRRQMTTSLDFLPWYDTWILTSTLRLAFTPQDNNSVSILYNIAN